MEAAHGRYGSQVDFVVVGVGVNQNLATIKRHMQRHPSPFTYYFDRTGAAVRAFEAPATGVIFALDARGRVVQGDGVRAAFGDQRDRLRGGEPDVADRDLVIGAFDEVGDGGRSHLARSAQDEDPAQAAALTPAKAGEPVSSDAPPCWPGRRRW